MEVAEQVRLVTLVEENALDKLAAEAVRNPGIWSVLCQGSLHPRYPNLGTLVHWAVWARHWDVVTMAVAGGADLGVRGSGSWMDGRTAEEYAAFLDRKANHTYYDHAEDLSKAMCGGDQGAAAMRAAVRVQARAELQMEPFGDGATLQDPAVGARLHDMVEAHCLFGLNAAARRFGPQALGAALVEPEDSPYGNRGTLAHWAVWYQHWALLRFLRARGCWDPSVRGVGGGWFNGRTAADYADFLDSACKHPFYAHRVEVQAALSVAEEPPAAGADAGDQTASVDAGDPAASVEHEAAMCCVCLDQPADHLVTPCRHLCLCSACAEQLRSGSGRCPICRDPIASADRVFMS